MSIVDRKRVSLRFSEDQLKDLHRIMPRMKTGHSDLGGFLYYAAMRLEAMEELIDINNSIDRIVNDVAEIKSKIKR